ncbi:sucrase/ferredoxin-like domain-containing protein [Aspergillus glaucus CBS 516.65]|uniref:Uncharacterized protein n=1 Tax=Aspergillus glaucus CBS 516.65 TaxID=1160497 RepID=A0A1L9V702_ASPGL|nr:hypothetical protein ASPGLDRAFT_52226 [Aspergillus glaucus CBS 516.65]OJJ79700.1 hypothetical protein ASPGLDRAFT_52226 [Aspergillus glaucus CBS 516.65]
MFRSLLSFGGAPCTPEYIFPTVQPGEDGPDCLQDCADCTVKYPKFKVDVVKPLYGHIKEYSTHVLVATGQSDWIEKVKSDKGSLMEAFAQNSSRSKHGKLMVSASNLQSPEDTVETDSDSDAEKKSTVLLLPSFTFIDSVRYNNVPELIDRFINSPSPDPQANGHDTQMTPRACPHDYVILLCSHRRRDARCGITAPLIKKELERHLRPLGLYRDDSDERPGGVGIYFVSHVGGHKYAANVLVYRKQEQQMIWLARVKPEHCEGIVRYTVMQGKVVHPESQLRGGFDRLRGVTSW